MMSTRAIGIKYNCTQGIILKTLKSNNVRIKVKDKGESLKLQMPEKEIIKIYKSKLTTIDSLADKYKCSSAVIIRILKENEVEQYNPSVLMKRRWDEDTKKGSPWRKKMMESMNIKPNKPENKVLNALNKYYPTQWKYTGDGSLIIDGLNPDFVNVNGHKYIIEVFGMY